MKSITPKELKARLDAGDPVEIIDVREDWEVARGTLAEATHIPMNDVPDELERIPQDKDVVIICHSGSRSATVIDWLQAQGYQNLYNLDGGILRWKKEVDPSIHA